MLESQNEMISVSGVDKFYGTFQALTDINLSVKQGERVVICGPSGSGKSTLIRCMNGLEFHSAGSIVIDGIEVEEGSKHLKTLRQEVGMVFQQFNLFPHLTILENLTIGPIKVRKIAKLRPRSERANTSNVSIFPSRLTNIPPNCLVGSNSASLLRVRCAWRRGSCCLMNQPRRLTPK